MDVQKMTGLTGTCTCDVQGRFFGYNYVGNRKNENLKIEIEDIAVRQTIVAQKKSSSAVRFKRKYCRNNSTEERLPDYCQRL
jgi:hypothetical protein